MQKFKVIKDKKIKIAVVGCGRISENHFKAIYNFPDDFELVAVCDSEPDALIVPLKSIMFKVS